MEDWQRAEKVLLGWLRKLESRESKSRKEGCFGKANTRMHRRAEAAPRVAADEEVRKNRSTCMLIVPPQ